MLKKLGLYYRTIKHLKPIQIRYRHWYIFRDKFRNLTGHTYPLSIPKKGNNLELEQGIQLQISSFKPPKVFTFLNQSYSFEGAIGWNFSKYGKLWAYNLNYFDYLHQPNITKEEGLELVRRFLEQVDNNREGLEPYPISLRGINWIKFLSKYNIKDKQIDASLYAQYQMLLDNLEYHLLGNHLLENGCSLLFGAYYFQDKELYNKAEQILVDHLQEQVLEDGGHFERSTMYHCILLERLMDCYNLVVSNDWRDDTGLGKKLKNKIELMLGWLEQMTVDRRQETEDSEESFVNGPLSSVKELPLLNDGAKGIGPSPEELFEYANRLEITAKPVELSESGYRKFKTENFELICDVGEIGPDYQPGHAHSDTFSFALYMDGKPVIIDPGISTYKDNDRRQLERSTAFHNTVQFEDKEQSEVWSAFRVGRRARVDVKAEDNRELVAVHDGYRPWKITHERKWLVKEDYIYIEDRLIGIEDATGKFYIHFHPSLLGEVSVADSCVKVGVINIEFESADKIKKYSYDCPNGYNQYIMAPKIEVQFVSELESRISLNIEDTE
ncbi:heparinase II/III domain-containing protein [Fodinibius sp. SL11]|uniref:heparinase II/III domain-containing protein n=1 Tax=Fodinibius sp. SL11 TaxID=3425690 RepID=UPI003F8834D9